MRLYEGLRVVEFTTNIAGPTIGRWLAEYGADVIHVERPVYGDDSRGYPPMFDGVSAQYHTLNHGKNYDAKNLMHTIRLLQMAKDIAEKGEVVVHRANRNELLAIKSGQFDYDTLIAMADTLNQEIDKDFTNSNLPDVPDRDKAIGVLNQIRLALYNN